MYTYHFLVKVLNLVQVGSEPHAFYKKLFCWYIYTIMDWMRNAEALRVYKMEIIVCR